MIFVWMFLSSVAGFLSHFLAPMVENRVRVRGWQQLTSYTMGAVFVLPFGVLIGDSMKSTGWKERYTASYLSSFVSFGIGNAVCRILETSNGGKIENGNTRH